MMGEKKIDPAKGRDGYSRSTGWYDKARKPKKEGGSEGGSTRPNINSSDFATSIAGIGSPNFGPKLPRVKQLAERGGGLTVDLPTGSINFIPGQMANFQTNMKFNGTDLDLSNTMTTRTLNAILATLTSDPNITLFIQNVSPFTIRPRQVAADGTVTIGPPMFGKELTDFRNNVQNLSNSRSESIRQFFINRGISPRRLPPLGGIISQETRTQRSGFSRTFQNISIQ